MHIWRSSCAQAARHNGQVTLILLLKVIHILAAIVAVGSNVTYAFWLRRAGLDRDRLVFTIEGIRRLDSRIANPAYVLVLLTGLGMVALGAFSFTTGWILAAIVLYVGLVVVGIAFFSPAIKRQQEEAQRDPTSPAYTAAAARSNLFGIGTLVIVLVIVFLMVTKPF
jgi:uncharacterized membrane protein